MGRLMRFGVAQLLVIVSIACSSTPARQNADFPIKGFQQGGPLRGTAYVLAAQATVWLQLYRLDFDQGRGRLVVPRVNLPGSLDASAAGVVVAIAEGGAGGPQQVYKIVRDQLERLPGLEVEYADAPSISPTGELLFYASGDTVMHWKGGTSRPTVLFRGEHIDADWADADRIAVVRSRNERPALLDVYRGSRRLSSRKLPVRAHDIFWSGGNVIAVRYRFPHVPGRPNHPNLCEFHVLDAKSLRVISRVEGWRPLEWMGSDLLMTREAEFGILSPPYKEPRPLGIFAPDLVWDGNWLP